MKKGIRTLFVVGLVLGVVLMSLPGNVAGKSTTMLAPSIAPGSWSSGTEVEVNLVVAPAPVWLELLTKGVKVTGPVTLCHSFRGGQYGWTGEIRQLVSGKWIKLATTNAWVPDINGTFTSCAKVRTGGTYALFGYFDIMLAPIDLRDNSPAPILLVD